MPKIKIKRAAKGGKSVKGVNKRPLKGPKNPVPQARRDSSSSLSSPADLSDEDGYSAVDDVSDSDDDDEEHVFAAEEEHIISNEWHQGRDAFASSPRPGFMGIFEYQDDAAADADNDQSDDDETSASQQGMQSFSSDIDFNDAAEESSNDSESWNGFPMEDEPAAAPMDTSLAADLESPVQRHVRFTGVPESESESDETDHDDFFPDIFVSQQSLDPCFRREIEQDDDDDDNSSVSLSFWDHTEAAEAEELSDRERDLSEVPDFPLDNREFGGGELIGFRDSQEPRTPVPERDETWGQNRGYGGQPDAADSDAVEPIAVDLEDEEDEEESEGYDSDGDTTDDDKPTLISRRNVTPVKQQGASPGAGSDTEAGEGNKAGEAMSHTGRLPVRPTKKPICVLNPHT
ncbi:hypothetical protein M406DRAFT_355351, partial [Cryphonectria parasitica EP155]